MFRRHARATRPVRLASRTAALAALALVFCAAGCGSQSGSQPVNQLEKLSQYGLFAGNGSTQEPLPGVVPYDLNTPLFSDYTDKFRFVKLPPGTSAQYDAQDAFEFPVGTIIAKTFAYPKDAREPALGRRLLETRILKREPEG